MFTSTDAALGEESSDRAATDRGATLEKRPSGRQEGVGQRRGGSLDILGANFLQVDPSNFVVA
jgi:hypothetical protein